MSPFPQLRNAPIREALIDVRFLLDSPLDKGRLLHISNKMQSLFPFEEERLIPQRVSQKFASLQNDKIAYAADKYEYIRSNKTPASNSTRLISLTDNGFTIRSLHPYGGWIEMIDNTKLVFDFYVEESRISEVVRLAARFINDIHFPFGPVDFDEYFRFGPQVPEDVPQVLFDFNSRIGVQAEPRALRAWIRQYLNSDPSRYTSVVLDIDVFRTDRHAGTWDAIANPLEDIRILKNKLFFGSLTVKALEAFK